jgi:hypothetical protein
MGDISPRRGDDVQREAATELLIPEDEAKIVRGDDDAESLTP